MFALVPGDSIRDYFYKMEAMQKIANLSKPDFAYAIRTGVDPIKYAFDDFSTCDVPTFIDRLSSKERAQESYLKSTKQLVGNKRAVRIASGINEISGERLEQDIHQVNAVGQYKPVPSLPSRNDAAVTSLAEATNRQMQALQQQCDQLSAKLRVVEGESSAAKRRATAAHTRLDRNQFGRGPSERTASSDTGRYGPRPDRDNFGGRGQGRGGERGYRGRGHQGGRHGGRWSHNFNNRRSANYNRGDDYNQFDQAPQPIYQPPQPIYQPPVEPAFQPRLHQADVNAIVQAFQVSQAPVARLSQMDINSIVQAVQAAQPAPAAPVPAPASAPAPSPALTNQAHDHTMQVLNARLQDVGQPRRY